jgi:hypothetical protein
MSMMDTLSGYIYAIAGSGGYFTEQGFNDIVIQSIQNILFTDVTNTLQVTIPYRYLNTLLGFKYDENGEVIYNSFDGLSFEGLTNDQLVLNANDFKNQYTSVLSVGKLSTIYSDFIKYVCDSLGYKTGFSSIFKQGTFQNTFDSHSFIDLLNDNSLIGHIEINNVTNLFDYLCNVSNVFENRNHAFIGDGFFPGDIIYIPHGFNIKLLVELDSILPSQSVNLSGNFIEYIYNQIDSSGNSTIDLIHKRHIEQCVYIPLVILLSKE